MESRMVRTAVSWGLLLLLCQQTLVAAHVLGRPYPDSDLAQLKNLLERFEENLAAVATADDPAVDYEGPNPEPEHSKASPEWDRAPEAPQRPLLSDVRELAADESYSRAQSQRSRLQDLLMATRSKAMSGCFGARMDRIGTSSGLGCSPKRRS
ncbi:cardiac hormone precursor [Salmo salar]|uniref:Cardiac hormone n=2 Tax=Salmo salar TaxID=8030 RepID=Q9YGJ1_SALSA|nr:cardiac hormone precursor [Salmo salar]CAA05022.1 cardiac hormone [Salmo salar]|eukprot:NP_001117017.1 cardiac hormone precursor [Salmo salar]